MWMKWRRSTRGLTLRENLSAFNAKQVTRLKVLLHLAGLLPFIWLFWAASQLLVPIRLKISSTLPVGWL